MVKKGQWALRRSRSLNDKPKHRELVSPGKRNPSKILSKKVV